MEILFVIVCAIIASFIVTALKGGKRDEPWQ